MTFGLINDTVQNEDIPEVDLTEQRVSQMLGDIKRNSRNRRIAMFAPVVLAAAVLGAMIAAPPRHGGLALVADAETPDPQLPRVFGSNGVWRLAKPIEEAPATDPGPADMIQAPTGPTAPSFMLLAARSRRSQFALDVDVYPSDVDVETITRYSCRRFRL